MTATARPEASLVARALSGHAALGLLTAALLYIVSLTGTLVVIHDLLQRWEEPAVAETGMSFTPEAAQNAMERVIAGERGQPRTTHFYIRMPTRELPRAVATTDNAAWYLDANGKPVAREQHSWTEFVIALHEYLTLPITWGMILVGGLGVALAALVVTGVTAHPRIVRDAFRLRIHHSAQLARADWHNRLGVWTMPFVLAVSLTGAFIGLGTVGFTLLAKAYSAGDMEAAYAPIFGHEPPADPAPAPLANVAAALHGVSAQAPDAVPTYVIVHEPGSRGSHIQILAEHPRRLIYGETYLFNRAGQSLGKVGLSDGPIGQQAAASTYNLHFGNYGGLPVQVAYMVFGLGLCVMTATGVTLWLIKRERRGLAAPRLTAAWSVCVWGTPLLLLACFWLRIVTGPEAPLIAAFWGGLALATVFACLRPGATRKLPLEAMTYGATIATAALHLVALRPAPSAVIALDIVIAAIAVTAWFTRSRLRRDREASASR